MKAYKGFNEDMTCRGFQFEVGKTYELPEGETAKLCESGFHACLDVLDCFDYYKPGKSVYCEVDLEGVTDETGNDTKRVGRKITIVRLLENVTEICDAHETYVAENVKTTEKHSPNSSASMGSGSSASMGINSSASMGPNSSARMGINSSASMGYGSVVLIGGNGKFRGGMWCVFAEPIWDGDNNITGMACAVVDGKTILPDRWYHVVDGQFVECEGPEDE